MPTGWPTWSRARRDGGTARSSTDACSYSTACAGPERAKPRRRPRGAAAPGVRSTQDGEARRERAPGDDQPREVHAFRHVAPVVIAPRPANALSPRRPRAVHHRADPAALAIVDLERRVAGGRERKPELDRTRRGIGRRARERQRERTVPRRVERAGGCQQREHALVPVAITADSL